MDVAILGIMIPLFGIVLGVTIAIVSIVTSHRQKMQRAEQRHRERLAAIDKGLDLPPDPVEPESGRKGGLRSGLVGLFVGVVLYFALDEIAGSDVALFGLIPAAVGVANLLFYFIEARKGNGNGQPARRD